MITPMLNSQNSDKPKGGSTDKKFYQKSFTRVEFCVHIFSSSNNTILTLTDLNGKVKAWSSAGSVGFRGSRRSTSYAAQQAGDSLAKKIQKLDIQDVNVEVKGFGAGREAAVRGLKLGGLKIRNIRDRTNIPHNGCRAPKKRRY